MRFFKRLLTFFLVSLGVASFATAQTSTRSADEIRARQLLEEKTRELEAAPKPRPAAPAVPSEKELKAQEKARRQAEENAKAAEQKLREDQERQERINKIKADLAAQGQAIPAPAAKPVVIVPAQPAPVVTVQTPDADAKARELLEQKTRALEAATPAVVAPPVTTAPAQTVVVTQPVAPAPVATVVAPAAADDPTRAVLEQKTRELGGITPPPAPPKTAATTSSKSTTSKQLAPPVVQTPVVESPLPRSKQQRLDDLLETYRMNLITPADYHTARAKILAEP